MPTGETYIESDNKNLMFTYKHFLTYDLQRTEIRKGFACKEYQIMEYMPKTCMNYRKWGGNITTEAVHAETMCN